jgi:hypothetical protein
MARNVYSVSTPVTTLQRHHHDLIGHRSANQPVISFVPEEVASLNGTAGSDVAMDVNGNNVRHVSLIEIGSGQQQHRGDHHKKAHSMTAWANGSEDYNNNNNGHARRESFAGQRRSRGRKSECV